MTMFGFCKSAPDIPIEHLDYKYIETCNDVNKLQKILQVLKSGEEGRYPELEDFAEKRLASQKPDSVLLEKSNREKMITELELEERQKITNNLQNMQYDQPNGTKEDNLPPIRTSKKIGLQEQKPKQQTSNKQVTPRSYDEWSKLDKEIENQDQRETTSKTVINEANPPAYKLLGKENINQPNAKSADDLNYTSQNEKKKGNEAFNSGDFEEALVYYNRSLDMIKNPAVYNNRAITNIKLKNYPPALADCNTVIQSEPNNIKAYLRRGIANQALQNLDDAFNDFTKVLELEPANKRGKQLLEEITAAKSKKTTNQKKGKRLTVEEIDNQDCMSDKVTIDTNVKDPKPSAKKGKRLIIEDIDTSVTQEGNTVPEKTNNGEVPNTANLVSKDDKPVEKTSTSIVARPKELPPDVVDLKNEGNDMYKAGRYVEAMKAYTSAIHMLMDDQNDFKNALAVLFSSRAMCEMKTGRCRECIHDCNKSLNFTPTVKAFLRRAAAFETIEKYLSAYSDFQACLQIDGTNATALQGISRLSSVLKAEHGPSWREKLPKLSIVIPTKQPTVQTTQTSEKLPSKESQPLKNKTNTKRAEDVPSQKSIGEQFKETKEKGNKCVQQGKYADAVPYYTSCIRLLPNEVPSYTNRALCFLKLNEPVKAIEDCDKALHHQPQNVKALFRRAQANKTLKQYKDALSDFSLVLKCEPNNTPAKKEVEECKQLFREELLEIQARNEVNKQKSKKMKIDEVTSDMTSSSSKPCKNNTKTGKCTTSKSNPSKPQSTKKMTGFEFLQAWNGIKSEKSADYAELLKQVEPHKLPELLSNKLDGDIIKTIIHTVHDHFATKEWYKFGISILKHVSRTSRFVMMLMFLSTADKTLLKTTVDLLEVRVKQNGEKTLQNDISNIRAAYKCS